MAYKYFSSSKHKRACDCSVRCIMAAEGMYWAEAYKLLCDKGMKLMRMPDELETIGAVLKDYGYVAEKAPMKDLHNGHKRRWTVKEFAKENKKGTFVLSLTGHVVCVKNGDWLDTWDCSEVKVFKVFRKAA